MPLKQELERCHIGDHRLKVIYESVEYYGVTQVVRWCTVCGSIVVDIDADNKTMSGGIMTMKSPNITRENKMKSSNGPKGGGKEPNIGGE